MPQSLKLTDWPWITQHVAPRNVRRWKPDALGLKEPDLLR
jgi:hypothetical protein